MLKELDHMIDRFPHHRGRVIELFEQDEDFQSLCIDYWQCMSNLHRLQQENHPDIRLSNEYKLLSLDLEQEALRFINKQL